MYPVRDLLLGGPDASGHEHRPREIDPRYVPAELCERDSVAACATAEIDRASSWPQPVGREAQENLVGR
jgi:hypothetical protein